MFIMDPETADIWLQAIVYERNVYSVHYFLNNHFYQV
jgi:hypothetical protein